MIGSTEHPRGPATPIVLVLRIVLTISQLERLGQLPQQEQDRLSQHTIFPRHVEEHGVEGMDRRRDGLIERAVDNRRGQIDLYKLP